MRLFFCALFAAALASGQSVASLLTEKLRAQIEAYDARMEGVLGVAMIDLKTGERWSYHGKTLFPQASAIKIPILIEMFRLREEGKLRFEEMVRLDVFCVFVLGGGCRSRTCSCRKAWVAPSKVMDRSEAQFRT